MPPNALGRLWVCEWVCGCACGCGCRSWCRLGVRQGGGCIALKPGGRPVGGCAVQRWCSGRAGGTTRRAWGLDTPRRDCDAALTPPRPNAGAGKELDSCPAGRTAGRGAAHDTRHAVPATRAKLCQRFESARTGLPPSSTKPHDPCTVPLSPIMSTLNCSSGAAPLVLMAGRDTTRTWWGEWTEVGKFT
jgi:hypothetical protein